MNISLHLVPVEQKHVIENLLELYSHDFSEITANPDKFEVNEDGLFTYPFLNEYWQEKDRFPYLIRVDKKIAGFVLVRQHSVLGSMEITFKIAEFFILRKYRRLGIGTAAGGYVFHQHLGNWEVPIVKSNEDAFHFWQSLIKNITNNNYQIIESNNEEWKGSVFSFYINE